MSLILTIGLNSCATSKKPAEDLGLSRPRFGGPRFFLASLDGSSPRDLYTLLDQGLLKPQGALSEIKTWAKANRALPSGISLTAPSHVSISTCASPDVHGIPANSFLRKGEEVSGFETEIFAETVWESAKRQGRKVLSVGFIAADGRSPQREASAGFAYPRTELLGKSALVHVDFKTLQKVLLPKANTPAMTAVSLWKTGDRKFRGQLFESQIELLANGATKEKKMVYLLWESSSPTTFTVTVDEDRDLSNGSVGILDSKKYETEYLDLIWKEQDPKSPIVGRKRRSFITLLRSATKKNDFAISISKPSYNNAYPLEFLEFLEKENLVWADKGFPDFLESGGRMSPAKYSAGLQIQNRLLAEAVRKAQAKWDFDVVLFYQPLIDSFQHAYFALQPEITAQNASTNPVLKTLVHAYDTVLKNVDGLFSLSEPRDVLTLVGDHGMEPVNKMINAFAVAGHPPTGVRIISSGGILLVYEDGSTGSAEYIQRLVSQLQALYFDGKPVTKGIYFKKETPERWLFGDANVAIHSGPEFYVHFKPEIAQLVIDPPLALGMHGHETDLASMATIFLSRDTRLKGEHFSTIDLRDVIPTAMASVGMKPPKQCQGQDLGHGRPRE